MTQEKILLQEMVIYVGDAIDTERIERSRQAIMNLGLFKSVTATVEEGNVLLITVEERYYILPFPLLDARPEGNYSYGAEMRFDNIAGLNQHLKITYEEKDSVGSDVPHSKESSITYSYPRLGGCRLPIRRSFVHLPRLCIAPSRPSRTSSHDHLPAGGGGENRAIPWF